MRDALRRLGQRVTDGLWPRRCAVESCGGAVDRSGRHVCSVCFSNLPYRSIGANCRVCDVALPVRPDHVFTCEACRETPPPYARLCSALDYRDEAEELVKLFKYRQGLWLAEDLTDLLEGSVRANLNAADVDAVMPVPLFARRFQARGYNQAAVLAEALARRLNRCYDARTLERVRDTPKQAWLSGEKRRLNVRDAFAVRRPRFVRGRTVLLVDDVTTTGATLGACAQALGAAGAVQVWCATVARAI